MKQRKNYSFFIKEIITHLGGKENIDSAIHCVSRLRIVLKDAKKINDDKIKSLDDTKGTILFKDNQYHIIVGTDVPNYFKEFTNRTQNNQIPTPITKEETPSINNGGGNKIQKLMKNISDIFIPIIPVIIAAGLILGIRNIFESKFFDDQTKALVDISPFVKGLNEFLWIPAQAGLWFLPVYIIWSVFKKFNQSQVLGIMIGLTLLIPPLINTFEISDQGLKWIWELNLDEFGFDFGSFKFPWKIAYTAQVIPAIAVGFVGVYLEKFFKKIITPVLHQIFVPLLTVLLAFILAMVVIGPLGQIIGTAIAFGIKWCFSNRILGIVFSFIIGVGYGILVITGLHHMMNAVMIQNAALIGGTIIFPILAISNIAQGTSTFVFSLIHRKRNKTKQIGISATISAWLGVTEPAMYGINLRYVYPFVSAIIGAGFGSLLIVLSGTSAAAIGNGGFLGILSIQANSPIDGYNTWVGTGYLWFALSIILTMLITSLLTIFLRKLKKFQNIENKIGVL